jgi:hypothetical protein
MDAYDLKNSVERIWQQLVRMPSSAEISKTFTEVPVYVNVDDELKKVSSITGDDDKIILEIEK